MSEVYDLTCYACLLLPESKLSQSNHVYHSFVPKLCHHRGKNTVPQRYTEKKAARRNVNNELSLSFFSEAVFLPMECLKFMTLVRNWLTV